MNTCGSNSDKKCTRLKSIVFGLLVIATGILLIYNNMGMLDSQTKKIVFSWQMLLIAAGFINIFGRSSRIFGLILMSVGGFFILPRLFELPENFTHTFWPLLVVIAGLLILFFSIYKFRRVGHIKVSKSDDVIDDVLVFSGTERVITAELFKGGKTVNVFGGSSYNLTQTSLAPGTHVLEVICVFGGTKIIVPRNWNIKVEVTSVLGAFEDKRTFTGENISTENTLIIKGVAVFGGGEMISY
jgi:predicted membrane protein